MTHLISIDHRGMVSVDGEPIGAHVTQQEEATLRAILSHTAVATKDALLTAVYGGRDEPEMKIFDVYVAKLRKKLGKHRNAIETVWGRGYCRGPDYAIAEPPPDVVAVMVNAKLIEDVVYCDDARRSASQIIEALLTAEHNRFWGKAA